MNEALARLRQQATEYVEEQFGPNGFAFLLVLIGAIALWYTVAYLGHENLPGNNPLRAQGWWNWHDQKLQRMASFALAELDFSADKHFYPVGYSLLGAPFATSLETHLYFIPNLFCVVGATLLLFLMARRFVGRWESIVVLLLIAVFAKWALRMSLLIPWSTIPTHFLAYLMITLYWVRRPSFRLVLGLSLLDGLVYLCRPGDAVFLTPLLVASVLHLPSWKERIRGAAAGMGLVAVFVAGSAGLNAWIHAGVATTAYEEMHRTGFTFNRLGVVAYVTWLDAIPIYRSQHEAILERMPWIVLVVPGIVYAVRKEGVKLLMITGTIVGCALFYVAYSNMSPVGLFEFVLIHYLTWIFPLLGLFAYLTLRFAVRELDPKITVATLVLPLATVWCLRLEEVDSAWAMVGTNGGVSLQDQSQDGLYDLVVLRGVVAEDAAEVSVAGKKLRRGSDYHWRRNYPRGTNLNGFILHFGSPVDPDELVFASEAMKGAKVEFRNLKWGLTAVPPAIMKRTHGREWGADPLTVTIEAAAIDLDHPVGSAQDDAVHTSGEAGVLLRGPSIPELSAGHYQITWYGKVAERGTIELALTSADSADATVPGRVSRIAIRRAVHPAVTLTAQIYLSDGATNVAPELLVDEQTEMSVQRVVLRHVRDWK